MDKKTTENRRIVLAILMEASEGDKISTLLKNALDKVDYMDKQDKAFITRLTKGCVERKITLDYVIAQYAKTKKLKPVIRNILRMAIYQILFMDSVKDFAACSEAVNLAKERGLQGLSSFVNGVLRNIAREKENIKWPDKNKAYQQYLSVYYSMPEWIVDYIAKLYGADETEAMLKAMNQESSLTIRVNEELPGSKIADLMMFIERSGVKVTKHPYSDYAYVLEDVGGVAGLPGFNEGLFTVQDISSQLVVNIAGVKKGDMVLDMCAAPGGKTVHAALMTGEGGKVIARDISDEKISLIEDNADRLGLGNVECQVYDASKLDESMIEKYDIVICDAPCSGLGVMGRKADIRYNASMDGIRSLSELQKSIIDNAVRYVKKGGVLVYSTCTITREENADNRDYILSKGMTPAGFEDKVSFLDDKWRSMAAAGHLQFLPGQHECDGFYISKYIKE